MKTRILPTERPVPRRRLEKQLQDTCTAFLELDDWRTIKTDLEHLRGLGVQEPGMCDRLYIRYGSERGRLGVNLDGLAEVLWIEWKKRGGKAAQHQKDWHARERARGALVLVADVDFPATTDGFDEWYSTSGLKRKAISMRRKNLAVGAR